MVLSILCVCVCVCVCLCHFVCLYPQVEVEGDEESLSCVGGRSFRSVRERWWYIALSKCGVSVCMYCVCVCVYVSVCVCECECVCV